MPETPEGERAPERTPEPPSTAPRRLRGVGGAFIRFLRVETTGGVLLLIGAALALVAANSPLAELYEEVRSTPIGIEGVFVLDVQHWAADFLLAFFFLVIGLELKYELVVGGLREAKQAMLPVIAAAGGMIVPAFIALAVAWGEPGGTGVWPVPVATDIAFALAVLALCARNLPPSLRVFLLTLAIADDIGAIALIAFLYSEPRFVPLLVFVIVLALWIFLQARRVTSLWIYVPLGLIAWGALYQADVHATIAGVILGLATRVKSDVGESKAPPALAAQYAIHPFSVGFAVPVFAFFSAGVALDGDALGAFASDRVALAVVAGLFIGKTIGVTLGALAAHRFGWGRLSPDLQWADIAGVAILCGCGFTVSLLIVELSFTDVAQQDLVKTGVLVGSTLSAIVGAAVLGARSRALQRRRNEP